MRMKKVSYLKFCRFKKGRNSPACKFLNQPHLQAQLTPSRQACIKEAMRMHPTVGAPFDRVVPQGGAVLSGQFVPEGTVVGITGWVTQRDKAVFGADADFYRPERWLEVDERQVRIMDKNMLAVSTTPLNVVSSTLTVCSLGRGPEVV